MLSRCAVLLPLAAVGGCSLLEAITACTPVTSKHGPGDYIGSLYYSRQTLVVSGRQIETYVYLNLADVLAILREQWVGRYFQDTEQLENFSKSNFLNCVPGNSSSLNVLRTSLFDKLIYGDIVCLYAGVRDVPQYWLSQCTYNTFVIELNIVKIHTSEYKIESIYLLGSHDVRLADKVEAMK